MIHIFFYRNIFNKMCANFSFVDCLGMEDDFINYYTERTFPA